MKGVEIFADLFLTILIVVEVILMVGLIWVFQIIYGVESQTGITDVFDNPRQVSLNILFKPSKYESTFLTFLELDCKKCAQKISMKEIMNAVAIQDNTDIWLKGENIDATQASEDLLDVLLVGNSYILKIREPELKIAASNDRVAQLQKVSAEMLLLDGRNVDLELYVG